MDKQLKTVTRWTEMVEHEQCYDAHISEQMGVHQQYTVSVRK